MIQYRAAALLRVTGAHDGAGRLGNKGWIISMTSPQYMPTFDLNRT
jgi:hypothetical protein